MKIAVSLPKDLYDRAEALAARRKKTRSALYAEALKAYIEAQDGDAIMHKLNEVYAENDPEEKSVMAAAVNSAVPHYDEW